MSHPTYKTQAWARCLAKAADLMGQQLSPEEAAVLIGNGAEGAALANVAGAAKAKGLAGAICDVAFGEAAKKISASGAPLLALSTRGFPLVVTGRPARDGAATLPRGAPQEAGPCRG